MKNREKLKLDMSIVAQNCSQFSPIASMQSGNGSEVCSWEVWKKCDVNPCSIGLFNVIASNMNLK